MNIKEQFEFLESQEYKFSLINDINALKEQCILEKNTEYYYKCILLMSDLYIEHQNNDEALNLLMKEIKNLDKSIFVTIYYDFLDRLIYLYINKRNYNVALRYISQKEKIVNKKDSESLNRLYLEYSYVYGNMNDLDKSLDYLQLIINNSPSDELKSVVYSNITKIYIDKNDVEKAKEYLNECLTISNDHESEVYNDYLLAKICVLEGKSNDALQLYDGIFVNEEINSMTLSMMNEYLSLLNKLKKYNKSLLLMNKLSIFINATSDLIILRDFLKNKLDYFIGIKDNNSISATKKEIENIEKIIEEDEKSLLNANIEEELNDIKEKTEEEAFNKIDLLTSLVDTALKGNTLREILMDFSIKVQKIINFDEMQFVLFNRVDEREYQMLDSVGCFKYKNKRLYEKKVPYESLKGSIVELMINNNKPVVIDFNNFNVDVKDIFNNSIYDRETLKFMNAIPCVYKDDIFAAVVYSSKETDLTNHSNAILLKIATKLIESSLIIQFIEDNNSKIEKLNDFIIKENNIGVFQLNNNTLYLSDALKQMLSIKQNSISVDSFMKKVSKSDINRFIDHLKATEKIDIRYKYETANKIVEVEEILNPITDFDGKILYYQGIIKIANSDNFGYVLSNKDLYERIEELKSKTKAIEFKFSFIKIIGTVDEYQNIKNTFGVEPYYLNDGSYIVVLENESNQRTLDRLTRGMKNSLSIIRYPRDIINIDEMLDIASIMIDQDVVYFTNNIYRIYIKKTNLINKFDKILSGDLQLNALEYKCFDDSLLYEIKPMMLGFDEQENITEYLKGEQLQKFEYKIIESFTNKSFDDKSFMVLSNASIYKFLTEFDDVKKSNLTFVMKEVNELTPLIIEKIKLLNLKLFIDYNIINKIEAYYFSTNIIDGIYIRNNNSIDVNRIFKILTMFNLRLICYNNVFDYNMICYYNNKKKIIN